MLFLLVDQKPLMVIFGFIKKTYYAHLRDYE